MPVHPSVTVCTHIKVNGVQCGSPALRGEQFCYFHQRMIRGVKIPPQQRLHPVALVEDSAAIQASLMEVINALCRNTIDFRRADPILKALYIAVKNASNSHFGISSHTVHEVPDFPAPNSVSRPTISAVAEETPSAIEAATATSPKEEGAAIDPMKRKPPARAGNAPQVRKAAASGGKA